MRITDTNIAARKNITGSKGGNKDRNIPVPVHADVIKKSQNKGNKESRKPLPPPAG